MTRRTSCRHAREDRVDPFIRSLVGWKADPEARLLVKLLEARREVRISGLSQGEARLLPKLKKRGDIKITAAREVRLTELGATIARGAKKLYPEFRRRPHARRGRLCETTS